MATQPAPQSGEPQETVHDRVTTPTEPPHEIQRFTGHGTIYCGAARVSEADYEIMVTPAELRGVTFEPGNEPKVSPDITGRLLGNFFQAESLQGVHTLRLADGREFDFRVLQPDTNDIIGVSWFRESA